VNRQLAVANLDLVEALLMISWYEFSADRDGVSPIRSLNDSCKARLADAFLFLFGAESGPVDVSGSVREKEDGLGWAYTCPLCVTRYSGMAFRMAQDLGEVSLDGFASRDTGSEAGDLEPSNPGRTGQTVGSRSRLRKRRVRTGRPVAQATSRTLHDGRYHDHWQ
jgi:hypothetical protein